MTKLTKYEVSAQVAEISCPQLKAAINRCFRERCSENMQQIYRRTPKATLLKSHFGMGVFL